MAPGKEVILEVFGPGDPVGAVVAYEGAGLRRLLCPLCLRAAGGRGGKTMNRGAHGPHVTVQQSGIRHLRYGPLFLADTSPAAIHL